MREREALRPDQVTERAARLLHETFGPAREPLEVTFAHASVGVMADHTHYFDGFALHLSVPFGVAVAVREATGSTGRVVVSSADGSVPPVVQDALDSAAITDPLARVAVEATGNMEDARRLDVAVVAHVPSAMRSGCVAAVAVASARAVDAVRANGMPRNEMLLAGAAAVENVTGAPFSVAYLLASGVTEQHTFVLADTATLEALVLDVPPIERPGWALMDASPGPVPLRRSSPERQVQAASALKALRVGAFPDLDSFRGLQHRDLERALAHTPRKLRPVVQHLVTENARVQRLVAAVRKRDWQMFGALLLMSHASKRSEWGVTSDVSDFIVKQAEQMSLEGIYGATHVGEVSGSVLIVGQPFSVPPFMERLRASCLERFEAEFVATLL